MAGEQPPYGSEHRTFICTVVFVDLVDYSQRPVAQQAALKRHLNAMINRALAHVAESDRMALDTGDGAALCFFGDPEDALFAAANLREAIRTDPGPDGAQVRIGINLGPARLVRDLNGNRNVIGDGINVAQRVMGFAGANQIFVSRSYYEVVSHISHEYARLFQYAGLHRDKHIREHELYEVHGGAGSAATPTPAEAEPAGPGHAFFEPELLARLTGALVKHLGPVAKLIVQRAALRARDPRQLVAAVADSLTGMARERFLGELADVGVARPPAAPPGGPAPPAPGEPERRPRGPSRVTPELLSWAEAHLARHVGPIARLLVAQAAKEVSEAGQLGERLAAHIGDAAARAAFLTALEGRGAP
jgi:class 3 adenylate cyclase